MSRDMHLRTLNGARRKKKNVPNWVHDNAAVQALLRSAFPKMNTSAMQKEQARRWAMVIDFYFKKRWTCRRVADELSAREEADSYEDHGDDCGDVRTIHETTPAAVNSIVRSIRRVRAGIQSGGRKRDGEFIRRGGKRGRPRKQTL